MKQLSGSNLNLGQYLVNAGRGLTRAGRLAGMIQVCRPGWFAEATWHAAQSLQQQGVKEYLEVGALTDYLAALDTHLTRFSRQNHSSPFLAVASESELQCWANRWQRYRDMTRADDYRDSFIAA